MDFKTFFELEKKPEVFKLWSVLVTGCCSAFREARGHRQNKGAAGKLVNKPGEMAAGCCGSNDNMKKR